MFMMTKRPNNVEAYLSPVDQILSQRLSRGHGDEEIDDAISLWKEKSVQWENVNRKSPVRRVLRGMLWRDVKLRETTQERKDSEGSTSAEVTQYTDDDSETSHTTSTNSGPSHTAAYKQGMTVSYDICYTPTRICTIQH